MKTAKQSGHHKNVSRRNLLKGMVGTGGLVLAAQFVPATPQWPRTRPARTECRAASVWDPHVFVSIAPDGIVTIVTHRSEMGTGSRTSLPMVVADEMEADWSKVKIVQARRQRAEIRQPGHGRLAQHPPLHPADARMRRRSKADAGACRGGDLGCFRCRLPCRKPQGHPRPDRQVAGLRRTRRRSPPR